MTTHWQLTAAITPQALADTIVNQRGVAAVILAPTFKI